MRLVITVGLPGSGKSTYLARLGVNAISSDEIRRLIADDPADQTMNARIFSIVRYLVRQRIAAGRPVTYVDATHLTPWERKPYVISLNATAAGWKRSSSTFPLKFASRAIKRATAWFPKRPFAKWRGR